MEILVNSWILEVSARPEKVMEKQIKTKFGKSHEILIDTILIVLILMIKEVFI